MSEEKKKVAVCGTGFGIFYAEAAVRIKNILNENRQNPNARFVDMTLSKTGLQISRS